MTNIPRELIRLAEEMVSSGNDGYAQKGAEIELRHYYDWLGKLLTPVCVKCGEPLVVPYKRDYVTLPEGKVCMVCQGGS